MIHIYTGNGKGKTTAAFGLAMRASGQGLKVIIFQFLKPKGFVSGEEISAKRIKGLKLVKFDQMHVMFGGSKTKLKKIVKRDLAAAKKVIFSGKYDMAVFDEIINAVDQGFIAKRDFLNLLKELPHGIELVLTGRGDVSGFEGHADYITIMKEKRHPFKKCVSARQGVEY